MFSWLSIVVVVICRNDARRHIVQPRYRGGARGYEPVENLIPMDPQHKVGSRILHASSTLLVELQEAQCFFIIAVAIAQIYAIFQNAAFSDADSLGGLLYQNDRVVISASLGMQCIALTQAGLRHARLSSFYSLFWATLGATLAGVAGGAVTRSDGELVNKVVDRGGEPGTEQCGGYTSLRQLCVVDPARFDIDGMLMRAASVVGATLLLLWLEALTKLMDGSKRRWSHGKTMAEALDILGTALRVVIPAIFAMFELILLAFTLISCIQMTNPAQVPLKQSWTIGQIIATLFWAPTVSKYGYIVICKLSASF